MLRHKLILVGALAVLMLLLACRGEQTPSSSKTPTPPAVRPTPTEPPSTLPQDSAAKPGINAPTVATISPAAMPASGPTPPKAVLIRISPTKRLLTPTALPPAETPSTTPGTPPAREAADDVAEIRRIVTEYWEALNEYDVDRAVTMLEPGYRAQEEELIRKDIGRMKLFRVKLEVSEDAPPTLNADGDYETYLSIGTPIDTRTVLMVFRRIEGRWWIVYSDEIE